MLLPGRCFPWAIGSTGLGATWPWHLPWLRSFCCGEGLGLPVKHLLGRRCNHSARTLAIISAFGKLIFKRFFFFFFLSLPNYVQSANQCSWDPLSREAPAFLSPVLPALGSQDTTVSHFCGDRDRRQKREDGAGLWRGSRLVCVFIRRQVGGAVDGW